MIFENKDQLKEKCAPIIKLDGRDVQILDEAKLKKELIDDLIYTEVFSPDKATQEAACWIIRRAANALGIVSASIQSLYEAMGRSEVKGFTVPAINIRALTYDVAQAVFRAAIKAKAGPVIFEIARSEIDYTLQKPMEYACAIKAAAIKTGYRGLIFLQGDHFQINAKKFAADAAKETQTVKNLIWEAIDAGFYNIDIDTSTLVDLTKATIKEQQKTNYVLAAELTTMIRDLEPEGITISVGGEIGEVGGKNSTVEELQAFMEGYLEELKKDGASLTGISKISVQTGTTHGGIPLTDGSVAKVKIDFDVLGKLSQLARSQYGLAGAVQHGASTLPDEAFDKFPAVGTAEIHLATGFQNMIYDSKSFPGDLREKIYKYIKTNLKDEWKEKDTEEQFIYKTRKKACGPFKLELWHLPEKTREKLCAELEKQFSFLFEKLKVTGKQSIVKKYIKPVDVHLEMPAAFKS
ncbi:MAG: aldolase [Deltaproteobacteria bacterium RBG_19FT_COMBO_43_11]|nr:MAG: aldolase [Deltaproteobacteria bacterium RBG_16_44_11]OGP90468.1 MAG: aldolase [Deltaproteobacteria bacterium RBG_19FT_COMBO_43_11]